MAFGFHVHQQAKQRRGDNQRQAGCRPVGEAFDETGGGQRGEIAAQDHDIERAVLAVGLKQPVEAQKRGEQRADPDDGGADAGEELQVRADAERDDGDDGEEEDDAGQSPAAGAEGEFEVAEEEGGHGW